MLHPALNGSYTILAQTLGLNPVSQCTPSSEHSEAIQNLRVLRKHGQTKVLQAKGQRYAKIRGEESFVRPRGPRCKGLPEGVQRFLEHRGA